MAKLPSFVQSVLTADRNLQLTTIATLVAYVFGEEKADRAVDKLGEDLHKQAPHRSVKTWQNYVSAVNAVSKSQGPKLESLFAEYQSAADMAGPVQKWLSSELTKKRYHSSPEDISNWASGKPSLAVQAKAKKAAEAAALKEQAKVDAAAPIPTQAESDSAAPATEAAALRDAIAAVTEQATPNTCLASFDRHADGTVALTLSTSVTRADIVSMALALEMLLDSPAYSTAEAEELAEA